MTRRKALREGVGRIATHCGTQFAQPLLWRAVAELAARQHGVIALWQLLELGLSESGARSWVARGRLHRIHRGVYAVGHPVVSVSGRRLAAVLACGPGAVLSHRSAAALWGLRPSARNATDVTVPGRNGRSRPRIDIHRCALTAADVTTVDGIPCTTVARTLLDLAEVVNRQGLERAVDQAEVLRVYDHREVDDVLSRAQGRAGAAALSAILENHAEPTLTRSELEERFLAICNAAGVERPASNAWVDLPGGGVEVDFLWRNQRLAVETDGRNAHGTRKAFESDRERDQRLTVAGWRPVRFTWRQIVRKPREVEAALRKLAGG